MKRKFILMTLLLISFIVTSSSISFAQESTSSIPIMLQDIKGKDELKGYINEIESIRSNINTISITSSTTKDKIPEIKIPIMLQDIKGKDELKGYINEIESIRSNINTISITSSTTKDKIPEIKTQINFYLSELSSVNSSLKNFETKYSNSQPDLIFANQIKILIEVYQMSLNQQLVLLDSIMENNIESSKLFYSDYLAYIYYYLNLGDQMISYVNTFYNL